MIVRELLTRIGYKVDKKSEDKAKGSMDRLKGVAGQLGLALSVGAIGIGIKKFIDAASDVDETLNVVTTLFEDQTDSVLQWAKTFGEAAGRSQYQLREYAAQIAQVTAASLGNAEATAEMSTQIAEATVDLASFNNETEADTLAALRAGLIGSYEPMQRLGIVLREGELATFALQNGFKKAYKEMTAGEKMTVRFRAIMSQASKKMGDATKTADGFANQSKRLGGNIRDLSVGLGQELLPSAAGFLQTINKIVPTLRGPLVFAFRSLSKTMQLFKAILIGLAEGFKELSATAKIAIATIGFFALAFLAPWLLVPVLIAAAVAGALVALGDLWDGISRGEGVLAGLASEFEYQLANTESWSEAMGEILSTSIDWWTELFGGGANQTEMIGLWLVDIFDRMGQSIDETMGSIGATIDGAIEWWIDIFGGLGDRVGTVFRELIILIDEISTKIKEFVSGGINKAIELAGSFFGAIGDLDKTFGLVGPTAITAPGSPAAARGDVNANQTIEVTVNAQGGDPQAIANATAPAVGKAAEAGNRRIAQQLLAGGATP